MLQPIYATDTKSDLLLLVPQDGNVFWVTGITAGGDLPPIPYRYDASSTATPDGDNVIRPNLISGSNPGRHIKKPLDYLALLNQVPSPSPSMVTRAFNTAFQPSTTRNTMGFYTVSISVISALLGVNVGTVSLQTSPNNSTYTTISTVSQSLVGVASTNVETFVLSGFIPVGYWAKLVTTTSGANTPTFTYILGQEISF